MNDPQVGDIASMSEFLAHALELELESAERYRELAESMEVHNNPEVAALFRELAAEGEQHAQQVKQLGSGHELPKIAPWDFKWTSPEGPESLAMSDANYLMNRQQALQFSLSNESRARDFYRQVASMSTDADVRRIAAEMATTEDEHVNMLRQWIAQDVDTQQSILEDLDPPNTPE